MTLIGRPTRSSSAAEAVGRSDHGGPGGTRFAQSLQELGWYNGRVVRLR